MFFQPSILHVVAIFWLQVADDNINGQCNTIQFGFTNCCSIHLRIFVASQRWLRPLGVGFHMCNICAKPFDDHFCRVFLRLQELHLFDFLALLQCAICGAETLSFPTYFEFGRWFVPER
jgi:hypothetical protein